LIFKQSVSRVNIRFGVIHSRFRLSQNIFLELAKLVIFVFSSTSTMKVLTSAEENYLKSIYHLSDGGQKNVSTNDISSEMKTKPASVSDMLRKLAEKQVIDYRKYYGVNITEEGKKFALQIIRKHR